MGGAGSCPQRLRHGVSVVVENVREAVDFSSPDADGLIAPSLADGSWPTETVGATEMGDNIGLEGKDRTSATSRELALEGIVGTVPYRLVVAMPATPPPSFEHEADISKTVKDVLDSIMQRTQETLSIWQTDSEVSLLGASNDTESWQPVSKPLASAFLAAAVASELSNDNFDPVRAALWHKQKAVDHQAGDLSLAAEQHAASVIDSKENSVEDAGFAPEETRTCFSDAFKWRIVRDGEDVELRKTYSSVSLDLCGVAKGWACAEIVRTLRKRGLHDSLFCWGGEACASGTHPDGRPWRLAIARPPHLGVTFREWKDAQEQQRPLWTDHSKLSPYISEVFEVPAETDSLWHFAASGAWARPKKGGHSELIGSKGPLQLKDAPGVTLALREPLNAEQPDLLFKQLHTAGEAGPKDSVGIPCKLFHFGAFADALATAATVTGESSALELLHRAGSELEMEDGQFKYWIFPADAASNVLPVTEQSFAASTLRALVRDEAARPLALLACYADRPGSVSMSLSTTVLCASLAPALLTFYLRRGSEMERLLALGSHIGIGFLRGVHKSLAAWLEARGGSVLLPRAATSTANDGDSWIFFGWAPTPEPSWWGGCDRQGTCPRPRPFSGEEAGTSSLPVPAWACCVVTARSDIGENILVVCAPKKMDAFVVDGAANGHGPLVRWRRQILSVKTE